MGRVTTSGGLGGIVADRSTRSKQRERGFPGAIGVSLHSLRAPLPFRTRNAARLRAAAGGTAAIELPRSRGFPSFVFQRAGALVDSGGGRDSGDFS